MLKEKYGNKYPRQTEIRNFDTIVAAKVIEANQKLYINRAEGFIGTSLKKDEFVTNCSEIDDVILFYKDGKYKVVKVSEKLFVGKNVIHIDVFKKNDKRTIYNVVYRDGKNGIHFIKRFAATGMTRDREYDLTQGTPGSKIAYFTSNPNGEAEVIKVMWLVGRLMVSGLIVMGMNSIYTGKLRERVTGKKLVKLIPMVTPDCNFGIQLLKQVYVLFYQ
jgi:topoisomerase-4 subunit A